ncbi:hypothetical protein [Nocardia callitridis]|uniref:hypothetical protein n=1 Tax=Nocardia callitridis TaxID=648753 RepID=UPI0031EB9171
MTVRLFTAGGTEMIRALDISVLPGQLVDSWPSRAWWRRQPEGLGVLDRAARVRHSVS